MAELILRASIHQLGACLHCVKKAGPRNSFIINDSLMPPSLIHNRLQSLILIACYDFDLDRSQALINLFFLCVFFFFTSQQEPL